MATRESNFLLNTENYDTLYLLVTRLRKQVEENENLVGRIAKLIDHSFRAPAPFNAETEAESASSIEEEGDELRHYLDSKYKLDQMKDEEEQFQDVENGRLRQLLCDNAKLMRILEAKKKANSELLQIYFEYERLLREVVLPKLAEDVSRRSIENIQNVKKNVAVKYEAEARFWEKYHEYVLVLERAKNAILGLLRIVQEKLDGDDLRRLETQFLILQELVGHAQQGNLTRKRDIGWDVQWH